MSTSNNITVTHSQDRHPEPSKAKAHHLGEPPTTFQNPWPSFKEHGSKAELFKLCFGSHPEKNFVPVPEGPNGTRSNQLVKVSMPHWEGIAQRDKLRATWTGHASFLVETPAASGQHRGIGVLFDPKPTPCSLEELPDPDIVCISHDRYDHLDFDLVSRLYHKLKGRLHFFDVTEMDWWQSCEVVVLNIGQARLTCCPTQHFSGRTPFDGGSTLWCSWALESAGKKLYFAGDTAYQAKDAPFDLALIPIGLYSPSYIAASVYVHPEQSLKIPKSIKSRLSIGMHYGTVRGGLSAAYEPVTDPSRRWREAAEREGIWNGGGVEGDGSSVDLSKPGVGLCHVGETVAV
ncbi:hypothetical protein AC579_3348 [Pseudocercospora musae]|uniref:Metallo-beta-lactamase domain-containing protein n=1 Tax=Pseudocercospora musae TaxID=113226 RepID=A0A139GVK0_9PEZI|nr:hypothetical protein AC579_3348 [Pseudocercospora musae]